MLQVFHMDVVKVDRTVAYVTMVVHISCKASVPNVSYVFQTYVANVFILDVAYVSHSCCKCFILILRMFL